MNTYSERKQKLNQLNILLLLFML